MTPRSVKPESARYDVLSVMASLLLVAMKYRQPWHNADDMVTVQQ